MRITSLSDEPVQEIRFLNAGKRPGDFYSDSLPVLHGVVDALPEGMSALVVTADLQGRETFESARGQPLRLLGEVLPAMFVDEILPSLNVGNQRIGVLMAGDFYTVPTLDRRGGSGDVRSVWQAFADQMDWVVGVAGNHDLFGDKAGPPRFSGSMHFLDGDLVTVDGLRIAGISGIPGEPRRLWRRHINDFVDGVGSLLCESPEIVIMHDGPDAPVPGCRGLALVREMIEQFDPTLVVRGHAHWDTPLAELANGTQVLNVDARAVVLTAN
ncbi:metallophosphoesterase family protein [Bremerella cremea]|uniref:metallophosphoesterase family protein n=1 Tax=Bremerella cremea TaxID=1031537 RepID=UPI0031E590CB